MITVDKPSFEQSLSLWRGSLAIKQQKLGISCRDVVYKEACRLVQTMIKIMPPEDKSQLGSKIQADVTSKFQTLDKVNGDKAREFWTHASTKAGHSDVRWYAFRSDAIFGAARDMDLSNANVDGLYAVYKDTKMSYGSGKRIIAGQRGNQTIFLWQRHIVKKATVKKLAAKIKAHIGRLKAGWLPAFIALGSPKGVYAPPAWVTAHSDNARGYAKPEELNNREFPAFTMENHAVGAGNKFVRNKARDAMLIRHQAMIKRLSYLIKHPDRIKEEVVTE